MAAVQVEPYYDCIYNMVDMNISLIMTETDDWDFFSGGFSLQNWNDLE